MTDWRALQALRLVLGDPRSAAPRSRRGRRTPGRRGDESDTDSYSEQIGEYLALNYREAGNRFPYEEVEAILTEANPGPLDVSHAGRLDDILAGWLQNGRDGIEATLSALFKAAAVAALVRVVAEYAKEFGLTLEPGSDVLARVARWAKQEAKAFLDRCNGRIMEGIRRLISSALRSGASPAEIANRIRDYLEGWVELAKDMAADEAALVREHGYYEANVSLSATTKQWFTVNDGRVCDTCRGNETQGAIPIGESFASGHQYPPAHVSCRCRLHYEGVSRSSALHAS